MYDVRRCVRWFALRAQAWQLWREGRSFELIDPTLGECSDAAAIMRCVKVALLCVQDSATDRPTMVDVTAMLATSRDGGAAALSLPDPRRPPHFSLRVSSSDDGSSEVRTRSHGTASAVVQRERPHHHHYPRGQMIDDPAAVSTTSIVILAGWDMN